ncbi:hypothetical protein DOTSEDRAFT_69295 [Dothistroma septosporum NZE10]|uniref:Copper acquisition factor BIM1-like domain-containing protein n=1 Tax=Dothistroma septosporum (strain NZE10 / CBS 128990) TaxID=675120 RepID=N1PY37_DOTSN|nr:hypothetical protein DOTSEDRAFT_69295 [Dothistroma septosporum NZE10]
MFQSFMLALAAASLSAAHFTLTWPTTAGFNDDDEPTAPCGGATVIVNDTAPEINVDRFAVAIYSSHPAGNWTFRATQSTGAPYNFTEIVPSVTSTGPGDFCLTDLRIPYGSSWVGSSGILQVIDNSVDGTLYQCAPVKFVAGANSTTGSSCRNNTGFSASFSSAQSSTSSVTSGSTASGTAAASSSSSAAAAAMSTDVGSVLGLGLLAAALAL